MTLKNDLARLVLQEQKLRFQHFNELDAWDLGSRLRAAAVARNLPLVIDIRLSGRPLFYCALPGTDADNPEWVRRKANVTQRYYKSSYRFGLEMLEKGATLGIERGVEPIDFATHGGSFPIYIEGTGCVGAITVSGVPQRDDHGFVVEVLCDYLGHPHGELALGPETLA